jgi:pimeloyl-ACP methyl ester carboxylesterase
MAAQKSTNGRTLLFGVLERVSPGLGARLLDRIWFRLPTVSAKARRLRVELPEPIPFDIPFGDGTLRGNSWGDGPTIYLVHGWGGWGLQLAAYIPPLLADGFRVVAYDGPSHGDSSPGPEGAGRSTMPELADAFEAVVAAQGPAYGVIAHSLGAAAFSQALKNGQTATKVVFLATATDFRPTLDQFQAFLGFGPRVRERFLRRFSRRFGPMEDFVADLVIEKLTAERELPELLVIHDRGDRETPYEGSVRLAEVWPGATVELTDGLGHSRVLWDQAVVESARAFLAQPPARSLGESEDRAPGSEVMAARERM